MIDAECPLKSTSSPFLSSVGPPFVPPQAFAYVGTEITWVGEGVEEYGHVKGEPENVLVRVDPRYFRPTEVELLLVSQSQRYRAKATPGVVPACSQGPPPLG